MSIYPLVRSYSLHGTDLHFTNNAKYLGVTINSKLKWKPHIDIMCKKANSTRGFIQRNLHGCPRRAKEQAYVTYVRPILEYTSSVWDPYYQDQIHKIEMVQRRAARFVMNDFHPRHSVTQMLHSLQWQPLQKTSTSQGHHGIQDHSRVYCHSSRTTIPLPYHTYH